MKKYLKIAALVIALAMLTGLGWFANAFLGNPVSKMLAEHALDAYLEEQYTGKDIYVNRFGYSFKTGDYFAHILSQSSQDTEFYIYMDMIGHVTYDSYENWVLSGYTTSNRLLKEYRALTGPVMEAPEFPYMLDFGGGRLEFWVESPEELEFGIGIPRGELEMDKKYDIRALGAQYGVLNIYLMDEEVTVEKAAEMALEIRRLYDESGVPFKFLDLTLRYPRDEDYQRKEGYIYCQLLYEDIYEEGLVQRVQQSHDAREAYFAKLDAENAKRFEEAAATE